MAQSTPTTQEQLTELQTQLSLLQKQIEMTVLQQVEQAKILQGTADALKAQVTSESELEKAQAQADFAKLSGIKAGLDSIGAPPGKEGKLTITTGTAGALLLNLKQPMLKGLRTAAQSLASSVVAEQANLGSGVVLATDAEIEAALKAKVTSAAIDSARRTVDKAVQDTTGAPGGVGVASVFPAVAAASLILKTFTDFSKFFRTDRSMTLFDAGEEANHLLRLMLESELKSKSSGSIRLVRLDDIAPTQLGTDAATAATALDGLLAAHDSGAAELTRIGKLADASKPPADKVEALRLAIASAAKLLDDLHPARKPQDFWAYALALYKHGRMLTGAGYLPRITLNAKAQTIQVIESRVFRADKIYGDADVQVDFRLVDAQGGLLISKVMLWSSKSGVLVEL